MFRVRHVEGSRSATDEALTRPGLHGVLRQADQELQFLQGLAGGEDQVAAEYARNIIKGKEEMAKADSDRKADKLQKARTDNPVAYRKSLINKLLAKNLTLILTKLGRYQDKMKVNEMKDILYGDEDLDINCCGCVVKMTSGGIAFHTY